MAQTAQGILELLQTSPGLFRGLVFIFGLLLGSFATCMIWRVPRGLPWFGISGQGARSICPSCGHVLGLADLVPFFSWALARRRCRYCASPVPALYPVVELVTGVLALGIAFTGGVSWHTLFALMILPFAVTGAVIPLQNKRGQNKGPQNKGAVSLQPLGIGIGIACLWALYAFCGQG